jgi:tetratricopeptide (TPR) repeat protein
LLSALLTVVPSFSQSEPSSPIVEKHWRLARAYLERGMRDHADEEARVVLRLDPGHAGAREMLAAHAPRETPSKPANTEPAEPATLMTEAKRAYRESRLADAERLAREMLTSDPANAEALGLLKEMKEEVYQDSPVEENPTLKAMFADGIAYYRKGEWEAAAGMFQKAHAVSPSHAQIWSFYTRSRSRAEERNVALGIERAKAAIGEGRQAEAKAELKRVLEAKPDHAEAKSLLASLGEDADAASRRARAREHFNRGVEAYGQGRWADSIREWDSTIALDPGDEEARGLIRKAKAKQAAARKAAQKRIPGLHARALKLYQLGKLDEAQKAYREILDLDPADEKAKRSIETIEGKSAFP